MIDGIFSCTVSFEKWKNFLEPFVFQAITLRVETFAFQKIQRVN